MWRLSFILVLFFTASALAEDARIAAWNLGGFHQIPQSRLDNIIEGLKQLDADVVVLPELNPLSHGQAIASALSQDPALCYEALVPDQPRAAQEIGFVFKCSITASSPGLVIGSDLDKQGYRNAAVLRVTVGQFDFVLVGLHLKAGRGSANRGLRDSQLAIISAYIQGVIMGGEKDVLVIGDYNMIPGEDDRNFTTLNADGSLRFVSSEDLSDEFTHITSSGSGNFLDGYAFTIVDQSEYLDGTVAVFDMPATLGLSLAQYRNQVTDHLPVLAVFNIDNDHD